MDSYYQITEAPLEPQEKRKLKQGFIFIPIVSVIFGIVLFILFRDAKVGSVFFYVGLVFITFFAGLLGYITWATIMDLKEGKKQIFRGLVTHKDKHRSTGKNAKTRYYLHFGKHTMSVDLYIWSKYNEGDMVEIHRAKRNHQVIFRHDLLKRGVMLDELTDMRKEREEKARKNAWKAPVIFISIIPVFLTLMFWMIADCFSCQPEFPSSINEWENVNAVEQPGMTVSQNAQYLIALMNDTLLDREEAEYEYLVGLLAAQENATEWVLYMADHYPQNDKKSALEWMKYKFDEASPSRNPLSALDIWNNLTFGVMGKKLLPVAMIEANNIGIGDIRRKLFLDKTLTYDAVRIWCEDMSIYERQLVGSTMSKQDTSEYSPGINQFMKETWEQPMALSDHYKSTYEKAREKYGIK